MDRAYRLALICGALPLVVGVSVFCLWLVTRWEWLPVAGVMTIGGGLAVFVVGGIALVRFHYLARRSSEIPAVQIHRRTLACAGLLLSNFVVGAGITATVFAIETCYTIEVRNSSDVVLDDVRVFGGGCDESLGAIRPGEVVRSHFWIEQDGTLELRASRGTSVREKTIDDYVTNNSGGNAVVTFQADGTISVRREGT